MRLPFHPLRGICSARLDLRSAACTGLIAALVFLAISTIRLQEQGLFYDELHQATGAFAYKGADLKQFSPLDTFSLVMVWGVPVLNMAYSAAIKTGIYGLYLRLFHAQFSVISWRLLGILFVSIGIVLFCVIARRGLSLAGLLIFLMFFLTDATVILATRHDWGPVALALLIRLVFLATWIHGDSSAFTPPSNTFVLGGLVGIAAFEKLSSIVLIWPLFLIILLSDTRRSVRHCVACAAGLMAGASPLLALNLHSFFKGGSFISLQAALAGDRADMPGLIPYLGEYVSLGSGRLIETFIFGHPGMWGYSYIELLVMGSLLVLLAVIDTRTWKQDPLFRMSGTLLLGYAAVGAALYVLPRGTWVHHWILGTPFQYAAILLAVMGLQGANLHRRSEKPLRFAFFPIIGLLLICRVASAVSVGRSFVHGDASMTWDPSLTKIGQFAVKRADEAAFAAADWGVATQIFCLSQGRAWLVYEPFWDYRGPKDIADLVQRSRKKILYLVVMRRSRRYNPQTTARIVRDMESLSTWREVPIDGEVAQLRAVEVRKFAYAEGDHM